jgi:hypothetical protein
MSARASGSLAIVCTLSISVGTTMVRATEGTHDFARYQVILDRAPFGQMVIGGPESQQPGFSTRFTFVGTAQVGPDQPLQAIIMDKEGNHVHFKSEGDTIGAISIVKIEKTDRGTTKLVMRQGLEDATFVLEPKAGGGGPSPGSPATGGQPGQPPTPQPMQPGLRRIPFRRGG